MASNRRSFSPNHPVVITFLIFAIIGFMYSASSVLKPLALAVLLSFALAPIVRFLENRKIPGMADRKVPRVVAVLLTVTLAIGGIGFMAYQVGLELNTLAGNVDEYKDKIEEKISRLQPKQASTLTKVQEAGAEIGKALSGPPKDEVQKVELAKEPDFVGNMESTLAPYLEGLETGFIVLILLLFLLLKREEMGDRIIQLFGHGKISLTTRTTGEVGERISKYLMTFAAMNTAMGIVVGIGCKLIGIEYAALWGFLAGALRFIPYAGPATAFALPLLFSVAAYDGFTKPLELITLYAAIEIIANMALEPIIYGKTTGVSSLALLVAAMFWSWLWGPIGLLLSTPLTVSLAVLGKYVPSLHFFATFLHEEIDLDPSIKFYQRLLKGDQDGASDVVDEVLKDKPRAAVFDRVIIPTLSLAERDAARDEIDERELEFVHRAINQVVDDLAQDSGPTEADKEDANATTLTSPVSGASGFKVVALPAHDVSDGLVLELLDMLVKPTGMSLRIGDHTATPLTLIEQINTEEPDLILISHLPPDGLTATRYLVKRIRARFPKMTIAVGRWDFDNESDTAEKTLTTAGANIVLKSLEGARAYLVEQAGKLAKVKTPEPVTV